MTKLLHSTALALTIAILGAAGANAQTTTTDIDLSTYPGYVSGWWTVDWGAIFPTSTPGNSGSGLAFANWDGGTIGFDASAVTIGTNVALGPDTMINTLINVGTAGSVFDTVTFTNNLGATDTFTLVQGETVRDVVGSGPLSGAPGSGSDGGSVTAVNWATGLPGFTSDNLDAQEFTLPTSWAETTLTSVAVTDPVDTYDTFFSGLQIQTDADATPAPEPMALSLFASGLLGLVFLRRKA